VIVIDASALTKFVLKEEGWEEVTPYLKTGATSIDLVVKEVANAVWKNFLILFLKKLNKLPH